LGVGFGVGVGVDVGVAVGVAWLLFDVQPAIDNAATITSRMIATTFLIITA